MLSGFQGPTLGTIQVPVGQTSTVDIRMRAAGVTETVTVSAEAPLVDTQRTDVSNVVGETARSTRTALVPGANRAAVDRLDDDAQPDATQAQPDDVLEG